MSDFLIGIKDNLYWAIPTITTFGLAVINFCFLNGQKKRQQVEICVSLMKKRIEIYFNINIVIANICTESECTNEHLRRFSQATREVEMFFGKEIVNFKKEVYENLNKLNRSSKIVKANINETKQSPNYKEICDEQYEYLVKIENYLQNNFVLFEKYIDFSKYNLK